jgi:hypothetical protein
MSDSIARKWHGLLLSTEPVDRPGAEAAVRAAYRSAGLAEPEHMLWCASPLEAIWAALVLIGEGEGYNVPLLQDVRRRKGGEERLASVRAAVAGRLGIGADEVEGRFGLPFYSADRQAIPSRVAQERWWAYVAAAEAGRGWQVGEAGPFERLDALEHDLFREGHEGGQMYKAAARAGAKQIAYLAQRSAQHRLYGTLAFGELARDEALAARGAGEPTDVQRAFQAAYEACGMWWPMTEGVVFAERPSAVESSGDTFRMLWADGFTLGAERPGEAPGTLYPEPASEASAPTAAILSAELPSGHERRIAFLRAQAGSLPYLDRYLAGEHEQVWKELVALGADALDEAHAADALAVAFETMHRVEANVRLLTERLDALGYRFRPLDSSEGLLSRLFGGGSSAPRPHIPPAADVPQSIAELEGEVGGPIPLSLRAFYEIVGSVDFSGEHREIAPRGSDLTPDPLFVYGARDACDSLEEQDEDLLMVCVAPDALHKANISGGDAYSVALPAPAVDAPLEYEPHEVTFVEYLRIAILRWGGFPGWEEAGEAPPEALDRLREGLIAF